MLRLWRHHFATLLRGDGDINSATRENSEPAPIDDDWIEIPPHSHNEVRLKKNKAAGPDGLPAELFKARGDELVRSLHQFLLLLLSFLDRDRNIGHQQRQLCTELLTRPVVSNQARLCLDSCTPFPQFVSRSHRVSPFFSQYHPELVGPLKTHFFAGYAQFSPIYTF